MGQDRFHFFIFQIYGDNLDFFRINPLQNFFLKIQPLDVIEVDRGNKLETVARIAINLFQKLFHFGAATNQDAALFFVASKKLISINPPQKHEAKRDNKVYKKICFWRDTEVRYEIKKQHRDKTVCNLGMKNS